MKKMVHKFIIDDKGAVSIYLIVITLLLFFFNAVLIDFARIIVAERQTEEAAKVALRSTMSSYHQSLQDKGLFAFDGGQAEAEGIFREVFANNIIPSNENDGEHFNLVGLKPVEGEITLSPEMDRSLANREILEYQILEEMKYKAPVELGEALIKNFLSISDKVEKASDYAKIAKDINKKAKDREAKLDEAEKLINEAKNLLDSLADKIDSTEKYSYPDIRNIQGILNYHDTYTSDLERIEELENREEDEDEEDSEDEGKSLEELRRDTFVFRGNAIQILENISTVSGQAAGKLEQALTIIEEAEGINNDIRTKIEESGGNDGDYDDANSIGEGTGTGDIDNNTEGTLDDYLLEEDFFTDLKESVSKAIEKIRGEGAQTNYLIPKVEVDLLGAVKGDFQNRNHTSIYRDVNHTRQYYNEARDFVKEAIEILKNGRKEFKDSEEEVEEQEKEADKQMEEIEDSLKEIEDAISGGSADNDKLRELGQKAARYGDAIKENALEFSFDDRDQTSEEAFSFMDMLFRNLGKVLLNLRDEAYINEYILMRFNSHDFGKSGAEKYAFDNNQVEYIIYGLETYGANHLAAMTEIFAVRFAIQFAAALMSPDGKLFGPLFWAKALFDAFKNTADDIRMIANGDVVDLFPNLRVGSIDYKGHLRLFLFAHREGSKFERMMAVLDEQTGQDLDQVPTYMTAEATASIRLWFLPQIADFLGRAEIISGRVEDNEFYIEKEVNYSY